MPVQVIMPQFGESVNEGTITRWLKAVGDEVQEHEPLVEINTDKVDTEVPSPASGVLLEIRVAAGAVAHAGTLLAVIGDPDEAPLAITPSPAALDVVKQTAASAPSALPTAAETHPGNGHDLGFISPVVAKIAGEYGVDLAQVKGSGLAGRITKKDIQAYIENRQGQAKQSPVPASIAPPVQPARTIPAPAATPTAAAGDILPLNPVRRAIAEHMLHSKHTSPHVTTIMEVDLSRVVAHRQANKEAFAGDGANLTFTAYFIAAVVAGLKAYPIVNSSWTEEGILLHREINIGMATSLGEAGLIVPVIKHADGLSLLGIARAVNDLAERARKRQLRPDEVQGGTFTLTNHGISGSLFATPIINQPQCAILGSGAIQKRAVVITDEKLGDVIAIRPMAYLGLTFDHRILDGAIADYFLGKVVQSLRDWI
jgi:2-oxoglutarate dehydrogenase dihydrolipoamide succinyltransferase (E2 component)